MKRMLALATVLFFAAVPAWSGDEPVADPAWADGGGCQLPDVEGLSEAEAEAAISAAGLVKTHAQAPACPVPFRCSSIGNCGIGPLCSVTDIGPCCTTPSGVTRCCITGTIKVQRCPCRCTGVLCSVLCASSTNVRARCS